ncbi:hypothetical protein E2C01_057752 [Portunus trituberculatus]|uniref:Uncharacterized protein n=1 Tax=Portunus trituberculatus TaxID=210409 RepID=A0A5B7GTU3_PORTR|nr:hypothetical protein [Portunus trituberculatus]
MFIPLEACRGCTSGVLATFVQGAGQKSDIAVTPASGGGSGGGLSGEALTRRSVGEGQCVGEGDSDARNTPASGRPESPRCSSASSWSRGEGEMTSRPSRGKRRPSSLVASPLRRSCRSSRPASGRSSGFSSSGRTASGRTASGRRASGRSASLRGSEEDMCASFLHPSPSHLSPPLTPHLHATLSDFDASYQVHKYE